MANKALRRIEILRIRILPEERASFAKAARLAGLEPADWIRSELRRAAIRDLRSNGETPAL